MSIESQSLIRIAITLEEIQRSQDEFHAKVLESLDRIETSTASAAQFSEYTHTELRTRNLKDALSQAAPTND